MNRSRVKRALPWLCFLYCSASLVHFVHNAEYLAQYPNLPDWLSRANIYASWVWIALVGGIGYLLYHRGRSLAGLLVLGVYAALGFDGLLHYTRAPVAAHSMAMNLTIWIEVAAAALLLLAVATLIATVRVAHRPTSGDIDR